MFGIDDALLVGLAGSAIAGGVNLAGQANQRDQQQGALQMAMQDYALRKKQMEQQYELATAGQQDARGNKTSYIPGVGWVTTLTPASQSMLNRSDAVQNQGFVESLGRGADERSTAFKRRLDEGSAASPLLDAMRYGYGAPSREGVAGASKIAGVTGASEAGDQARSGYSAAALRTGSGGAPLQTTISNIDRGATQGIRSALARGDAEAGPLFQQMTDQFNQGKLNPYNMLASRASNVENIPFNPEGISGSIDMMGTRRAAGASGDAAKGLAATSGSINPVIAAMLGQRAPNYDTFIGGLTENIKPFFKSSPRQYGDMSEAMMERVLSGGGLS